MKFKKCLLLFLFLFPLILFADTDTEQDIQEYAKENQVQCSQGFISCTAAFCGNPYYNEKGEFILPDNCNSCTAIWTCDDGKQFVIEEKEGGEK